MGIFRSSFVPTIHTKRLSGESIDLEDLYKVFGSSDPSVSKEKGNYYLTSSTFDQLVEVQDVLSRAVELLATLNGIMRTTSETFKPVMLRSSVKWLGEDGMWHHHETLATEVRVIPSLSGTLSDGSSVTPQRIDEVNSWIKEAMADQDIEEAMYFFREKPPTWWSLRKVYEVIEVAYGGQESKAEKWGWATGEDLTRFKRSANDPRISGRDAVHARHKNSPFPYSPMSSAGGIFHQESSSTMASLEAKGKRNNVTVDKSKVTGGSLKGAAFSCAGAVGNELGASYSESAHEAVSCRPLTASLFAAINGIGSNPMGIAG